MTDQQKYGLWIVVMTICLFWDTRIFLGYAIGTVLGGIMFQEPLRND